MEWGTRNRTWNRNLRRRPSWIRADALTIYEHCRTRPFTAIEVSTPSSHDVEEIDRHPITNMREQYRAVGGTRSDLLSWLANERGIFIRRGRVEHGGYLSGTWSHSTLPCSASSGGDDRLHWTGSDWMGISTRLILRRGHLEGVAYKV